jgi:hypothetical protein
MLRKALQSASEGKKIGVDWHDDNHWPHCMDYLVKVGRLLCYPVMMYLHQKLWLSVSNDVHSRQSFALLMTLLNGHYESSMAVIS